MLLFDRVVLPTPENDAEVDRWMSMGWRPDELATRVVQLGDVVDLLPWDDALRDDWQARWEKLKAMGRETEALAYGMTPMVIAQRAWNDVFLHAQQEGRAPDAPVPVIWCPAAADAISELHVDVSGKRTVGPTEVGSEVGVLFRRELAHPVAIDPEEALETAVKIAMTDDFTRARRALFEWELIVAGQEEPLDDALVGLRQAADRYDELVEAYADRTVRRAGTCTCAGRCSTGCQADRASGFGVRRWLERSQDSRSVRSAAPGRQTQPYTRALH